MFNFCDSKNKYKLDLVTVPLYEKHIVSMSAWV